jgi:phosphoglycolate phosphatase-like HAD superfamily hydrolase
MSHQNTNLVIFDIDGTLVDTNRVDEDCFVRAFAQTFGISLIKTNWVDYPHVTDSGITYQIFQEQWNRTPSDEELTKFKKCFCNLLNEAFHEHPNSLAEISGALKVFNELKQDGDWQVAIATGGWRNSALLKLEKANFEITDVPFASADDGIAREDIINTIIEPAKFKKIVLIGDGIWDFQIAAKLGLAFIGIGDEKIAKKLIDVGCDRVFKNFRAIENIKSVLEVAKVPKL